jgi:hypothetical protein
VGLCIYLQVLLMLLCSKLLVYRVVHTALVASVSGAFKVSIG